jgi:hypothetical protein
MPVITTNHHVSFKEYALFFEEHAGCVFISPKWLDQIADTATMTICSFSIGDKIIGMVPYSCVNGRILSGIQQLPLTPYTDICWNNSNPEIPSLKELCLKQFMDDLKKQNLDYITLCFHPSLNFGNETGFSYILDLGQTNDELFRALRNDKQRNIKKAEKSNVSIEFIKNDDLIFDLVTKTFERQQGNTEWMRHLRRIVNNASNSFQITAYLDGKPGCSLFFIYDKQRCYYIFGGIDPELEAHYLGPFTMWKGILHAKAMQIPIFDFEGSSIPSIEQYFKSFGARKEYFSSFSHFNWRFKALKWLRII